MQRTTCYKTFDGKTHMSTADAQKHLDVLYGNILLPLAHKLAVLQKSTKIAEFIDQNLPAFIELSTIKNDMTLTNEGE